MTSFNIEQVPSSDIVDHPFFERLLNLDEEFMKYHWSRNQWLSFCESENERTLLLEAFSSGRLVGFNLFHLNPWTRQAHLLKIVLEPFLRGSGAAGSMFETSKQSLREIGYQEVFLEVETSNERAVGFYLKQGFRRLCVKPGFYSDGSNAQALLLTL